MNLIIWICQTLVAVVFLYSGITKTVYSEKKLVSMGQTGVEGLNPFFIRFIGITEILGVAGLILPLLLDIYPMLTSVSAACLGFIMIPASVIHYKRIEFKNVIFNTVTFVLCYLIAYYRY